MKCLSKVFAAAAIIAAVAAAVAASRGAVAQPAGQSAAAAAGKVGVIDSDAFANRKTGVARLVAAFNTLESEFKPRQEDLRVLQSRKESMEKELRAGATSAKIQEFKTLEDDIKRKVEDANRDYERRSKELSEPISNDLNQNLREYARQRDIAVIMDISKLAGALLVVNDAVDITDAFIADYNRRNPAPATPARP